MTTERKFGLLNTILIGLSGAIGFEVFALFDYPYHDLSGHRIVLALLLAGLINLLIMLSYSELSAAMPTVGGEYTYIKNAFSGYLSFMSGCFRWLASIFVASLAALFLTYQLAYLFSFVSMEIETLILGGIPLIAPVVVMFFTVLDIRGRKQVGSVLVVLFLAIFAIFISSGILHGLTPLEISPQNIAEDVPKDFAAAVYVFPMFFGVRALVASANMVRRPERNVPRGILLSSLIIIPLYIGLACVAAGVVSPEEVSESSPFLRLAAQKIMGPAGGLLMSFAGIVAGSSALSTSISVQSSIAQGMSRDGYLPRTLLSKHPRFGTPYVALVVGALFMVLFSSTGVVAFLAYAGSFSSLLVFAFVNLSLLKLRNEKPHMDRHFKTPLYPLTPISGFIMSIVLLVFPLYLGDVHAVDALVSGLGVTALALITYYLRMLGLCRVRIAVGGISLAVGALLTLLASLAEADIVSSILPYFPSYVVLVISLFFIISGILNVFQSDPD